MMEHMLPVVFKNNTLITVTLAFIGINIFYNYLCTVCWCYFIMGRITSLVFSIGCDAELCLICSQIIYLTSYIPGNQLALI